MFIKYKSILILLILFATSSCTNAQKYDLSTKDGVFDALESITGEKYDKNSKGCLKRPKELPNIILVGDFAHDLGCRLTGGFVGQEYVKRKDLSESALKSLGWEKAPKDVREGLALNWVKNGMMAFGNPLDKATKDFTNRKFEKPRAKSDNDGNITITLWLKRPAGMICEDAYSQVSYAFSKDGRFQKRNLVNSFRIPCE